MHQHLNGVAPLPHLGVILVEGDDAASFLHGQLTQDFVTLDAGHGRLAAFCNAKGRMLASFVGFQASTGIALVVQRDILAPTLKRLSMFVLRAKTKLRDATGDYLLHGLAGDTVSGCLPGLQGPWTRAQSGAAVGVELYPAERIRRAIWMAPAGSAPPSGDFMAPEIWSWGEVRSGIAAVSSPIVEAFVPQMLNYESVGGVNFKKGCYPGQEIVARSQFRGTLKRRAYLMHGNVPLTAGEEVFHEADATQPCGLVAQAAPAPEGGWEAIVSIQTAAAQGGLLTVGGPSGSPLELLPLPYLLMTDV